MANLLASPTVSLSKILPLWGTRVQHETEASAAQVEAERRRRSRHKLRVVVLRPLQEVGAAPRQEVVQSGFCSGVDSDVVSVRPNLQTHQNDADVQSAVQLQAEETFRGGLEV